MLSRYGNKFSTILSELDSQYGESGAPSAVKVGTVNKLWRILSPQLSDQYDADGTDIFGKGDYMDQRKHEFFSYFYNEDGFGLQFDINKHDEQVLSGYTQELLLETIVREQKAITQKLHESDELSVDKIKDIN